MSLHWGAVCVDSKSPLRGADEVLSQRVLLTLIPPHQGLSFCTCLGMAKTFYWSVGWVLTVCAKASNWNFLLLGDCNLRLLPYRDLLLRIPDPSPLPCAVHNEKMLSFWVALKIPSVSVCPSIICLVSIISLFLHCLSQISRTKLYRMKQLTMFYAKSIKGDTAKYIMASYNIKVSMLNQTKV